MYLYLLSQDENNGYDTYSSIVVCAENEEQARMITPCGATDIYNSAWASSPENVSVSLLGVAAPGIEEGIVLASFHAG